MAFLDTLAGWRDALLDPILGPLLSLPSFWAILILSLAVSLIITLVYKYTTDQNLMKDLKKEIKEFQKLQKELKDKPQEMMKVQREAMQVNFKYMKHSFKSTFYTIIPILLIFGWMNGHFAFESIQPGEDFSLSVLFNDPVTGEVTIQPPPGVDVDGRTTKSIQAAQEASWTLSGGTGTHTVEFLYGGDTYSKDVLITENHRYLPAIERVDLVGSEVSSLRIDYEKNIVLNLFGWKLGWLGSYIIFSIIFSLSLRKILRVY